MKNLFFKAVLILLMNSDVFGRVIDFSKEPKLLKFLEIHECRQKCYLETTSTRKNQYMDFNTCHTVPDCYMCHDYCEILPTSALDLAIAICSDVEFCSKGCRIACHHHRILGTKNLQYETQ